MWQWLLYLKLIFRGWQRNRLSFVLSLLSLILGLTCSLLSFAFVVHELRIAGSLPVADDVYLLRTVNPMYGDDNVLKDNTGPHLAAELADIVPEIVDVCVIDMVYGELSCDSLPSFADRSLFRVSPSFAQLFTRMQVTGNLEAALASPDRMVITRSHAQKWFGEENPLGKQIRFSSREYDVQEKKSFAKVEQLEIAAVIEDGGRPGFFLPSLFRGRILSEQEKERERVSWSGEIISFVKLAPGSDVSHVAGKLDEKLSARHKLSCFFAPADEIYFGEEHSSTYFLSRDRVAVRVAFWVALSMLFVALFNYINLTMTRTLHRLRNVGQQWVFGATKQSLGLMLLLETTLQVLIGLLLSCFAIRFLLPHFNGMMEVEMKFDFLLDPVLLLVMAGLMITLVVLPVL
ncbi:MAG: ABC transporter permease, partial [Bacteroidales bacterium]